ncbi:matrixin family metalloprotease [Levilactobacillus senmaizukei]|uniref:matrixin family metalloprotease n=1 Tax=Levilactobacillus senmaizukei TaxID=431273 RepID=UPI000B2A0FCC|nr:matrixin family metalloprotease [Levilactobacillus senmaizukei]
MKKLWRWLMGLGIIAAALLILNGRAVRRSLATHVTHASIGLVERLQNKVIPKWTGTKAPSSASHSVGTTDDQATPIEASAQDVALTPTYYYHFTKQTPKAAQEAFLKAVKVYNQTGVVDLRSGTASGAQNELTFSIYHKAIVKGQTGIELGIGGVNVTRTVSWEGTKVRNQAKATFNATYPRSFRESVALHEIGHAMGLAHSSSTSSVMYPYDRGNRQLSPDDIAALKKIYR